MYAPESTAGQPGSGHVLRIPKFIMFARKGYQPLDEPSSPLPPPFLNEGFSIVRYSKDRKFYQDFSTNGFVHSHGLRPFLFQKFGISRGGYWWISFKTSLRRYVFSYIFFIFNWYLLFLFEIKFLNVEIRGMVEINGVSVCKKNGRDDSFSITNQSLDLSWKKRISRGNN